MPELPEVETVKEILNKIVDGRTIKDISVLRSSIIDDEIEYFKKSLINKTIINVSRIGKFLIFHLSDNIVMLSHLRMEGKYIEGENENDLSRFARVVFKFTDGKILNYDDSRVFGYMAIRNEDNYDKIPPISNLGYEPIKPYDLDNIYKKVSSKRIPIKETILDQSIISGLGNIYADETLFMSKIHPETPSNLISKAEMKMIMENACLILNKAIKAGGSTIRSYHPAKGVDGLFQESLLVYDQKGKPCPTCGRPLNKIFVGGRGTTYCSNCQKNKALPYSLGITGPIGAGKSTALKILKEEGFDVLDSDQIVRDLYKKEPVQNELIKIFGNDVTNDGQINKKLIAETISEFPNKKKALEKYIHPLVIEEIRKFIKAHKKEEKVAVEVQLLFQSDAYHYFTETLIIESKENEKRIVNRGEKAAKQAQINKTVDYSKYKKIATYVIDNNGDINNLKKQLLKISK